MGRSSRRLSITLRRSGASSLWHHDIAGTSTRAGRIPSNTRCDRTDRRRPPARARGTRRSVGRAGACATTSQVFASATRSRRGRALPVPPRPLLIYDIPTRTWQFGPPLPVEDHSDMPLHAVVVDGKLFVLFSSRSTLIYDPNSESWTEEAAPPWDGRKEHACVHNGRLVIVSRDAGGMFERATDGSWSRCEFNGTGLLSLVSESVLLG